MKLTEEIKTLLERVARECAHQQVDLLDAIAIGQYTVEMIRQLENALYDTPLFVSEAKNTLRCQMHKQQKEKQQTKRRLAPYSLN